MTPRRIIIPVFVPHAGCPNECVFCNQRRISGAMIPADADTVRNAINNAADLLRTDMRAELAFYGGSFTAIPSERQDMLLNAALPFLRSGMISSIRLSTRPDCIDHDTLDRLKKFGVSTIELGSQSMCDEVLTLSNRGHTADDTRKASILIKEAGFSLILQMMTGLPGDNLNRSIYTAQQIISLKPDGVRIYPTVIIRDTELCDMWMRGEYKEHTVEDAVSICSEIVPLFRNAGIPIIRLGLNPTDDLSSGDALGGAYHPAFGNLVYSRIYLKMAEKLLINCKSGSDIILGVSRGKIPQMVGQKRSNILALCKRFDLHSVKVRETDIPDDGIVLLSIENN